MKSFDCINSNSFALLAAILGILISLDLDVNEQNAIGNFFLSLGQTTLTKAAQYENQKEHDIGIGSISRQVDDLSRQLEDIKRQLKK